jgi:hypothetical protein
MTESQRLDALMTALAQWVNQRPGLDFGNYGDVSAYRAEVRSITKDRTHAHELMRVARWSVTTDDILNAAKGRRLTISEPNPGEFKIDYCTGQYWPTEYRAAVCSVLASALWRYWAALQGEGATGDSIRAAAKRNLSIGIVRAYFR